MPSVYYVYIIFRSDGSPCYVGKGTRGRWRQHHKLGRNHYNPRLAALYAEATEMPIVKVRENLSNDEAVEIEKRLVAAIGRHPRGPLVNMTDGGEGMSGYSHSEESKQKIGRNGFRGRRHSEETRKFISTLNKGRVPSTQTRAKLSAALKGNKNSKGNKGHRLGPETKAKISAKAKGHTRWKGKHHTAETRAKISAARRARR